MGVIGTIVLTTGIIESITLVGRFGLNISTKNIWIKTMNQLGKKHWFHFHHVFLGIIMILLSLIKYNPFLLTIGIGIAISDVIHHLILWFVVGNPEFHLIYKMSNSKGTKKIKHHLIHKITEQSIQK